MGGGGGWRGGSSLKVAWIELGYDLGGNGYTVIFIQRFV